MKKSAQIWTLRCALSQKFTVDAQKRHFTQGSSHDPNGASGRETVHLDNLRLAEQIILYVTFRNAHAPVPVQQRISKEERNSIIRARHAAGEGLSDLAREYEISPQRVWQIVRT